MKTIRPILSALLLILLGDGIKAQTTTFNYTGAVQTYTVGACDTALTVDVRGAQGAAIDDSAGMGGRVLATIYVTPGAALHIYVGGAGTGSHSGGWNGGGDGANSTAYPCGRGGGASDIRMGGMALADRIVVAGGGGGGGNATANYGGDGGGLVANPGLSQWGDPGGGGTQAAGGVGGCWATTCGQNGALGLGGNGYQGTNNDGAGGGGGYYGGGGGGGAWGGGGGGSSYTILTASGVTHSIGYNAGNGQVIITVAGSTGTAPTAPGTISGSATVCTGVATTFSVTAVTGATSYNWTVPAGFTIASGQGTNSISSIPGMNGGTISVTASNACGASAASTFAVTVYPSPSVLATTSADTICAGDTASFNATGANSYSWYPAIGLNATTGQMVNASPNMTTLYSVVGTDMNGCTDTADIFLFVNPAPPVYLGPDTMICDNAQLLLDAGDFDSYLWQDNSTASTYNVDGAAIGAGAYSFYVKVSDSIACTAVDTIHVAVSVCIGLNDPGIMRFTVTPIPSDGIIRLNVKDFVEFDIVLSDMQGNIILQKRNMNESNNQIDLSGYSKGIYYLQISDGKKSAVAKIILQ